MPVLHPHQGLSSRNRSETNPTRSFTDPSPLRQGRLSRMSTKLRIKSRRSSTPRRDESASSLNAVASQATPKPDFVRASRRPPLSVSRPVSTSQPISSIGVCSSRTDPAPPTNGSAGATTSETASACGSDTSSRQEFFDARSLNHASGKGGDTGQILQPPPMQCQTSTPSLLFASRTTLATLDTPSAPDMGTPATEPEGLSILSQPPTPTLQRPKDHLTAAVGVHEQQQAHVQSAGTKSTTATKLTLADVQQSEEELRANVQVARQALQLFLNSNMHAAEEMLRAHPTRLYFSLGSALLAVFKAFMTFDHDDLVTASSNCKDAMQIASLLRKPSNMVSTLHRAVRGTGQSASAMHKMTLVQRHAELVMAESTMLRSVMGIVLSGDLFTLASEALRLRSAYGLYRSFAAYLDWVDSRSTITGWNVDEDFRSGVYLGNGTISMVFGLLPSKVLKIAEIFGYTGNCTEGLGLLARAGRWAFPSDSTPIQSGLSQSDEGLRRAVCDMTIMSYHLVISTYMPVQNVNVGQARMMLQYYLGIYPQGVFFRYFGGRLHSTLAQPGLAIAQFAQARDVQTEHLQLRHICIWEMALCSMSLCDWASAASFFQVLLEGSSWSPAVYSYGLGASLHAALVAPSKIRPVATDVEPAHESGAREPAVVPPDVQEDDIRRGTLKKAQDLMKDAPERMLRVAGKSIPLEKFVQKKAARLLDQGYLLLPALELSYAFHCMTHAPTTTLTGAHLPLVQHTLDELRPYTSAPHTYRPDSGGAAAWLADWCLAHFLHGVVQRNIAYPLHRFDTTSHTEPGSKYTGIKPTSFAPDQAAEESLRLVAHLGPDLTVDQYLVYFTHLELGRLQAARGQCDQARAHFELILSLQQLDRETRKGKYALQNMCLLRAHGELSVLPPVGTPPASSK